MTCSSLENDQLAQRERIRLESSKLQLEKERRMIKFAILNLYGEAYRQCLQRFSYGAYQFERPFKESAENPIEESAESVSRNKKKRDFLADFFDKEITLLLRYVKEENQQAVKKLQNNFFGSDDGENVILGRGAARGWDASMTNSDLEAVWSIVKKNSKNLTKIEKTFRPISFFQKRFLPTDFWKRIRDWLITKFFKNY
jgi:hypothetical protein